MLRKLINFIVVLAVVVAISGIFIHLYNNSKNENDNFDTTSESSSNKKAKKKKEKKDSTKKTETEQSNSKSDSSELDDNDVVDDSNESNSVEDNDNSVAGSEVAVVSTGTKENIYIAIFGGIVVIAGTSIILKVNKDGV